MPNPVGASLGFLGLALSVCAIAALSVLSVWGIVAGAQETTSQCNGTIPLNTWLIVSGSVFVTVLPAGTIPVCKTKERHVMIVVSVLFGLFNAVWSAFGWASLGSCTGTLIGNLAIATLVFQIYFYFPIYWISLFVSFQ